MLAFRSLILPAMFAVSGAVSPAALDRAMAIGREQVDDVDAFATAIAVPDPVDPPMTAAVENVAAGPDPDDTGDDTDGSVPAIPKKLRVARSADGLFYIHASVNGTRVRFVIDTGSSVVVLAGKDASALGLRGTAAGAPMQTAGGAAPMAWATLRHVKLGDRSITHVRAAIVRQGLPVSLMGQNLLSRMGSLTIEGDSLRLG